MSCNSYFFALRHGTGAKRAATSRYIHAVALEKERKEGVCAKTLVRATRYMYNLENKLRYSKYVAPLMSCIKYGKICIRTGSTIIAHEIVRIGLSIEFRAVLKNVFYARRLSHTQDV